LIHSVQINPTGLDWRHFLVAVTENGVLLGCGQIKPHQDGTRELASIAVEEASRGEGVARDVIEALLMQEEARPLYLMCRSHLILFYNKFGFHAIKTEEMPPYFQRISRIEAIFNSRADPDHRLAVMRLD
jgi:predicted GNAT family N-acyltransferase